jgi:hypothetical protein
MTWMGSGVATAIGWRGSSPKAVAWCERIVQMKTLKGLIRSKLGSARHVAICETFSDLMANGIVRDVT